MKGTSPSYGCVFPIYSWLRSTRHKRCDEKKPTCSQCVESGWKCDFLPVIPGSLAVRLDSGPLSDFEITSFEYFHSICIPEFSLYFELDYWGRIISHAVFTEECFRHAALSIGVLSRSHYIPSACQPEVAEEYALNQYNLAIRKLNAALDATTRGWELAILGSIVFIALEVLLKHDNKVMTHLQGAFGILQRHFNIERKECGLSALGRKADGSSDLDILVRALFQIREQMLMFDHGTR